MLSQLSEAEQKNNQDNYLSDKQKISLTPKFQMINFFDLDPKMFKILNPYNLEEALETINNLTSEKYKKNYLDDFYKKDFEFRGYEEDINFSIDNISFLASTKIDKIDNCKPKDNKTDIETFNYEYISLVNLVKSKCIIKQENNDNTNENEDICDSGLNFKITNKDEGKKEINIKCMVNPEILEKNIMENLIKKSPFPKAKKVYKNIINYRQELEEYRTKSNGLYMIKKVHIYLIYNILQIFVLIF